MDTLTAEGLCTEICLDPGHFPTNYVPLKKFRPDHKYAIQAFEKTNTELGRDPGKEQYLLTIKMLSVRFVEYQWHPRKIAILRKWNTAAFYESVNEDHYEGIIGVSLERCNF